MDTKEMVVNRQHLSKGTTDMQATIKQRGKEGNLVVTVSGLQSDGKYVPINFPLLTMHILGPRDTDSDTNYNHFVFSWSNYGSQTGPNPGKFKLQRIEFEKPIRYVKNLKDKFGRQVVDVLWHRQNDHKLKPERTEKWGKPPEAETIVAAKKILAERFGENFANQVIMLFMSDPLFNSFYAPETEELQAA